MTRLFLAFVFAILALGSPVVAAERAPTILISIDGFRANYLDLGATPVLSAMAERGARGAMRPSFPSKTYPNHYALVTGLRPDRNGIVDNSFADPRRPGEVFKMSNRSMVADAFWWNEATPIWVTAERAGLITAPIFWPGTEAAVQGVRPRHSLTYDMAVPNAARVDHLLGVLDAPPHERPAFLTLYVDTVDTAGHHFGPASAEVRAAVAEADSQIGRMLAGVKARGLKANVLVVADHGMAALSEKRRMFIDDLLPEDAYTSVSTGAFWTLNPAPGREAQVAAALLQPRDHLQCWRKADIPARFHYGANPRVAAFFCLPDVGWTIGPRDAKFEPGSHGYDPASPEMAAIFVASGPAFRSGVTLPAFDNVSVYPLLARLLGVKAVRGDGRLADTVAALKSRR